MAKRRVTPVRAESREGIRWSAAVLKWGGPLVAVIICALGVFWVPWLLPQAVQPVVSDAQVAGYSNRAAMIAVGLAFVVAFACADWRRTGTRPFVVFDKAYPPIGNFFVGGAAVVTAALTIIQAFLLQGHPFGEANYFISRIMYLANGSIPYRNVEFSYGPGMLYPVYWVWLALRPFGMSGENAYYLCLTLARVGALFMLAWVMNQLGGARWVRRATFLAVAAFAALQVGMGLQYSLMRFVPHLFLLLWVLESGSREAGQTDLPVRAVVATVVAFLLSPEIGIALLVALFAACALLAFKRVPGAVFALCGLAACAVAIVAAVQFLPTFLSFAGGGYYLPAIANSVTVIFLLAFVLVASAAGEGLLKLTPRIAAAQLGWVVCSLVLVAAAFGRADFGHVIWNGLAVLIVAPVVLWQWRPVVSGAFVAVLATTLLVVLMRFSVGIEGAPLLQQMVGARTLSVAQAMSAAEALHVPQDGLLASLRGTPPPLSAVQSSQLLALRGVGLPSGSPAGAPLDVAFGLAARHALVPMYTEHTAWGSWSDASRSMTLMSQAQLLLVPAADWVAAESSPGTGKQPQPFMTSPATASNAMWNGSVYGVAPFDLAGKNAELDIQAVYSAYLTSYWYPAAQVGSYVVLAKN